MANKFLIRPFLGRGVRLGGHNKYSTLKDRFPDFLCQEKSSDSKPSEREEKCHPASAIPVPRLRSRSSSLPTTPRGANATGRSITPRRSASGEPTRRNASATKPSNLYEIAKPLLQPGILRESLGGK